MDCDALLMLGTDFPYKQFYPTKAKIAQVDIRPENLGRRCKLDLGLVGDVGATLEALLPSSRRQDRPGASRRSLARYEKARHGLDQLAQATPGRRPIHPQYLARLVSEAARRRRLHLDVGTPTVWAARYLAMNGRRRLLGSFVHGSMANALPQAIGAQAAQPGRQVISLSGDGGFTMLMGDLHHAQQQKPAGEGRDLQQRHAGLRRAGDEGCRASSSSAPTSRIRLRRHGPRHGYPCAPRRRSRRPPARPWPRSWPMTGRRARRRHGHAGASMPPTIELEQVKGSACAAARRDERPRRRGDRPRQDQSVRALNLVCSLRAIPC